MHSHEVLKFAFDKTSPKAVASELGVSASLVYKWAQDQSGLGSGSKNPLDRIIQIYNLTDHVEIIEWLCKEAGGYFVKEGNYDSANQAFDVLPATNEILHQFSELLTKISGAAQDNDINQSEASEIRNSWNKLKGFAEGFVQACEQGDFELINQANKSNNASPDTRSVTDPQKPRTRLY